MAEKGDQATEEQKQISYSLKINYLQSGQEGEQLIYNMLKLNQIALLKRMITGLLNGNSTP